MSDIHGIFFNTQILFSLILGLWAAFNAGRGRSISGNFWGAVATFSVLIGITLVMGIIMTAQGFRPKDGRLILYYLYMAFLLIIMPGLFTLLRGRDDRAAGLAFAILAWFNAGVGVSMVERQITGPWVMPIE
ncbi:MAG: hypothetical protein SH821_13865 [Phototrophicales bacterium]|nr:hypothetical protein [Phototrophicales bacterium]